MLTIFFLLFALFDAMNRDQIEFRVKFGLRLRELREKRKLKQVELAAKISGGKDKQVISRYETEGANPTAYQIQQISEALNYTINSLFDFSSLDPIEIELGIKRLSNR